MNPSVSAVAWYGAVVSTLGFALALYVALRDRPRLRIGVQANMKSFGATGYDPDKAYTMVSVANIGRRTVTVAAVWFSQKPKGSGDLLLSDSMREGPKEVAEGKSVSYLVDQERFPGTRLHRVFVRDQAGRVWTRRVSSEVRRAFPTTRTE